MVSCVQENRQPLSVSEFKTGSARRGAVLRSVSVPPQAAQAHLTADAVALDPAAAAPLAAVPLGLLLLAAAALQAHRKKQRGERTC